MSCNRVTLSLLQTVLPTACSDERSRFPLLPGITLLKIPRGTQCHTLFHLKGQGMPFLNADNRGDLLTEVIIQISTNLT